MEEGQLRLGGWARRRRRCPPHWPAAVSKSPRLRPSRPLQDGVSASEHISPAPPTAVVSADDQEWGMDRGVATEADKAAGVLAWGPVRTTTAPTGPKWGLVLMLTKSSPAPIGRWRCCSGATAAAGPSSGCKMTALLGRNNGSRARAPPAFLIVLPVLASALHREVLKARYYPDGRLEDTVFSENASSTWQAIQYGLELLKKGLVLRVGNGESIRIWRDKWLPRSPSGELVSTQGTCRLRRVSELLDDRRAWRTDLLHRHFHPVDVNVINKICTSPRPAEDILARAPERNGIFIVRCPLAVELWKAMAKDWSLPDIRYVRHTGPEWLFDVLEPLSEPSRMALLMALWQLWHVRNEITMKKFLHQLKHPVDFYTAT
ncbi:Methionine S-methyltransferase [Hordeum vulgare]|nr:Methionine S-methyltransferase [Hordeum vulgare]